MLIISWSGYYGYSTYDNYLSNGIVSGLSIVKKENPANALIEHLRNERIPVAYTNYSAHVFNFQSGGEPIFNEFHVNPLHGLTRKNKSASISNFAVVLPEGDIRKPYEIYLKVSGITCERENVKNFLIISKCGGDPKNVNRLRSLVRWVWQ